MANFPVIKADGTGDYTTVLAFLQSEAKNNYGEMTIGVVDGLVSSGGTLLFHKAASDDWPHGVGLIAAEGQAYNGANLSSCARISHSSSVIEQGDVDLLLQGLYVIPTGGYNIKTFRFAASYPTTQRRSLTIHQCAFATAPFYHGTTAALYFTLVSSNSNSQYDLDLLDVVVIPRASTDAVVISALSGNLDLSGTINRMTIAPTNVSGTGAQESLYAGAGSACTLAISSVLALGSQSRTNYTDYVNAGFAGTVTNIVTADGTGTITGATGATQLEDVAAQDYRLKSTSYGFGAFPQAEEPQVDPNIYDITASGGEFSLSGGVASTEHNRVMSAAGLQIAYSGLSCNSQIDRVMHASGGQITLSGGDSSLLKASLLTASGAVFSYIGDQAELTYSQLVKTYEIIASGAEISFAGANSGLTVSRLMSAGDASFNYQGLLAGKFVNRAMLAGGGLISCELPDAELIKSCTLSADGGSYSLSGGLAQFNYSAAVNMSIVEYSAVYCPYIAQARFADNQFIAKYSD